MKREQKGPGLRERKRIATQRAVEKAAVDLGMEHGYDHVTVEMICEVAEVSQSTFFNYFGTKEAAFVGLPPQAFPDDLVEQFVTGTGPILEDLVGFIIEVGAHDGPDPATVLARRHLIAESPALLVAEMTHFAAADEHARELILARFAHHGRTPELDPDLLDEAGMVVAIGAGVMRQTFARLAADPQTPFEQHLQHSVALVRRITREDLA